MSQPEQQKKSEQVKTLAQQLPPVQAISFNELPALFKHVGAELQVYLDGYALPDQREEKGTLKLLRAEMNEHDKTKMVLEFALQELKATKGLGIYVKRDIVSLMDNYGLQLLDTLQVQSPHPRTTGTGGAYKGQMIAHDMTKTELNYVVAEIKLLQGTFRDTDSFKEASLGCKLSPHDRRDILIEKYNIRLIDGHPSRIGFTIPESETIGQFLRDANELTKELHLVDRQTFKYLARISNSEIQRIAANEPRYSIRGSGAEIIIDGDPLKGEYLSLGGARRELASANLTFASSAEALAGITAAYLINGQPIFPRGQSMIRTSDAILAGSLDGLHLTAGDPSPLYGAIAKV